MTNAPTGARAYSGRHADLQPLLTSLAWFYSALEHTDQPLGTGANDNDRPLSVPDVDPKPQNAEELVAAHEAGALRIAETGKWRAQFVRIDGELEPRVYWSPTGAITHIWGKRVGQDVGRTRRQQAQNVINREQQSMAWYCQKLKAVPPARPRRSFRRRPMQKPIDWAAFSHIRGDVPLAEARAACGLPPADNCALPGLPWQPEPGQLFAGLAAGRGARSDGQGSQSTVRRVDPDTYAGDNTIVDRVAVTQFAASEPDHYATLLSARYAGSMGDLVPSNDNKSGKSRLTVAAEALQDFLAA